MTIKLDQKEINWISNEFKNDRSISEIATDTGMSISNVKRALAEANLITLDWYKTTDEIAMLKYLRLKGITNCKQLKETI